jgi:hypothetical protein
LDCCTPSFIPACDGDNAFDVIAVHSYSRFFRDAFGQEFYLRRPFGRQVPYFRSSNLWDDTEHTITVDQYQPLDLLLFSPTHNAWGAHVAVHVGNDRAIHLSRRVGLAAVWPLAQFAEYPQYRVLLGGKRALFTNSDRSF